jgi:hypothetical protein
MDSINDLLRSRNPSEPPQILALKKYVKDNYDSDISVRVSFKYYLITVPNASLANKLHVETAKIIKKCNLEKALVIHIG